MFCNFKRCSTLAFSSNYLFSANKNVTCKIGNRNFSILTLNNNPNYKSNYSINVLYTISNYNFASTTPKRLRKKEKEYTDWRKQSLSKQRKQKQQEQVIVVEQNNAVNITEGIARVCRLSNLTHDETIALELKMNLDPRKGDELIRGNILLPHSSGKKKKRVCVFVSDDLKQKALDAGADIIGDQQLLSKFDQDKKFPFDIIISTPDQIKLLAPYARILGPLHLMPTPKLNTLTNDPITAIQNYKKGQLSIMLSSASTIKGSIGKVSLGEDKIMENLLSFIKQIRDDMRPLGAKKQYFLTAMVSSTYGRAHPIAVDNNEPWVKKNIAQ